MGVRGSRSLVAWDRIYWQVAHRRVSYDREAMVADLEQSGAPFAALSIGRLRAADWISPS
jgi:hypothetical protein